MAKEVALNDGQDWDYRNWEKHEAMLDKLQTVSNSLPEGEVVGAVLHWPVADGSAFYTVLKEKPLTVAHIPYGDQYQVDKIMIRGLNKADVLDMLASGKRFKAIFAQL